MNIRSSLSNIYKRMFVRVRDWKVLENCKKEVIPVDFVIVHEILKSYKKQKKPF